MEQKWVCACVFLHVVTTHTPHSSCNTKGQLEDKYLTWHLNLKRKLLHGKFYVMYIIWQRKNETKNEHCSGREQYSFITF